ncbi:MAG: PRD domain-containing protein [Lachnospiraceae bacterium]|nr:PRD domain-containing protein [Lachnospiraceae bacterium]
MKLIKKINNNFALAQDSKGEQMIAEGKGIGFMKMPCDLQDYGMVTRTYYSFDSKYLDLINDLPLEVIDLASEVYDYLLKKLDCPINPNLPFILADHISFTIERMQKNISYTFPMYYELKCLYPVEYEASLYAAKLADSYLHIHLPENELAGIILNIVNAEMDLGSVKQAELVDDWVSRLVEIIETSSGITISREGFNFSRFVSHVNYLCRRITGLDEKLNSQNVQMYEEMAREYPVDSDYVEKFAAYLKEKYKLTLDTEEKLYLLLHVNRLCSRELQ